MAYGRPQFDPFARLSASAQDFSFGRSIFEGVDGNPDGPSVSGVAGISLNGSENEYGRGRDKDKDKDGIDWDDVQAQHERMREQIRQISVGGINLSEEEWKNISETLSDPNMRSAVEQQLRAQGKSEAQIQDGIYLAQMASNIAQKKARGEELTAEERGVDARLQNDPNARALLEDTVKASQAINPNDLTVAEQADANISSLDRRDSFFEARAGTLDDASQVNANYAAREGLSVAGSTDLASSFEAGFTAAPEFNAQASGNTALAQVEPSQVQPSLSAPVLS